MRGFVLGFFVGTLLMGGAWAFAETQAGTMSTEGYVVRAITVQITDAVLAQIRQACR